MSNKHESIKVDEKRLKIKPQDNRTMSKRYKKKEAEVFEGKGMPERKKGWVR